MKILVTGGAGFIGSNLCRELLKDSKNIVFCLDNLYCSSPDNIEILIKNKNFTFINADVMDILTLDVDQIYHLACPASPKNYQSDPIYTIKTNVLGTINMLELAKKCNADILLSSTSEIYGDPLISPQHETYWGNTNCIGIRSCYDEGKRLAETLMFDYNRQHSVKIHVARIFNTYGPYLGLEDGRVVSNFIMQALTNKDITIYGDGKQTRSFCYVDDTVNGLIKLMNSIEHGPINIGNPVENTIIELAKIIISLTDSNSNIVYENLPEDDPKQRKPDISRANRIGWKPNINLMDGLKETIRYFLIKHSNLK